jgi:hypothetical protein
MNQRPNVDIGTISLVAAAKMLGGEVTNGQIRCPGPGHSPKDRSLSVRFSADAPEGFVVNSFSTDSFDDCRDYVRKKLGLPAAKGEARTFEVESYRYEDRFGVLYALAKRLNLDPRNNPADKAKLSTIIKTWRKNKVLATECRKDEKRKDKEFIIPGPAVMSPNHQADDDDE